MENIASNLGLPVEFISKCKISYLDRVERNSDLFRSIRRSVIKRHVEFLVQENINIEFSDDFTSVKIGDLRFTPGQHGLKYCGDESHRYLQYTINDLESLGQFIFAYEAKNASNDSV